MPLCSWDSTPHRNYNYYGTGNVEEVLPGVLKPLAADFVMGESNAWARGIIDLIRVGDLVEFGPLPSDNIFAIVAGRVVVNIAWLGAFVATYQPERQSEMLTQYLRGDEEGMKSGLGADVARAGKTRAKVERLWAAAPARAEKEVAKAERARVRSLDGPKLAGESEAQLLARLEAAVALCGEMYVRHSQTTMAGGEYLGLLGSFLDTAVPGHPPEWTTTLTSALGVVSSEPMERVWELAQVARKSKPVAAAFKAGDFAEVRARTVDGTDGPWTEFAGALATFLQDYGFRGQGELDPSTPDWGEDATFVLSAIRANLGVPAGRSPAKLAAKAATAREKLTAAVEKSVPAGQREEFRLQLARTQRFVKARELTKANLARTSRSFRPPARELGRRLEARGVLATADDVWFLRLDELGPIVSGELGPRAVSAWVTSRKAELETLRVLELPVVFTLPVEATVAVAVSPGERVLHGMGVSGGVARGRARVILSAEAGAEAELADGDVLVAPLTDAAWTPLFFPAAAVVVERGGMLSHASTVAREFGLPAVVAVANATRLIPDGAMVTVDGTTGTVTIEG